MTKKNTRLLLALVCLLLTVCVCTAACSGSGTEEATKPGPSAVAPGKNTGSEKLAYTLVLTSEGGMPLQDVGVYFYTDSTLAELVWFAKTDAEGKASFEDLASDSYVAVLDKVPDGYKVEAFYPLTDETTQIILSADMAEGELETLSYALGDVMMNFSVTGSDGTVYVLSELLQQKKAVVLNFWYLECAPCRAEFPFLQDAYSQYSEQIEVLALNPVNTDSAAIDAFRQEQNLTFPMLACDPAWAQAMQLTAYPTTVVIDRFGTIALIHRGSIDNSKTFTDAFAFFTAEDYKQTAVKDILDLEIKEPGSDSENPIEIGGKTSFEVTVGPGQLVYYHLYRLDNMFLTVNHATSYVVYNNRTYEGTTGFTVHCPDTYTPAAMAFGNSGTTTRTYTVTLEAPRGSFDNPYDLKLEEFTTKVNAGNDQGVYYLYTAEDDGKLTVQCTKISPAGIRYDYTLLNEDTMAMRTIQEDGDKQAGTVSISVKKGHQVRLTIGTLPDESNSYPAATFTSTATLGEDTDDKQDDAAKIDYAITVTDADRNPISGVTLRIQSPKTEETDGTAKKVDVTKATNAEGVITTKQVAGTYDVTLTLPGGYTAATTQFQITEDTPFVSLKLDKLVVKTEAYTITVVDAQGKPVANAMVTIGADLVTTNAEGKAVFELPVGEYTVYITAGGKNYSSVISGENLQETIDLSKAQVEQPGPDAGGDGQYTVRVLDYAGNPQSGVAVRILKNGVPAAMERTGADGTVTAQLESADYTVVLAFSGQKLYYEEKKAVLPSGTTDLTIRVAPANGKDFEMIYDMYTSYYVSEGGTYVKTQANVDNYFIFTTKNPGQYRVTTSDPEAIVSYWGGSTSFIFNGTASLDGYDPASNSFRLNVKQKNIPDNDVGYLAVIGITGASDCILEIIWIGDPILDETDMEAEIYEAKTPPKPFRYTQGKKLTYVDVTGKTDSYKIVMGSDGYYHLNSATGPLLYVNLGPNAPYVSLYNMLGYQGYGGTSLNAVFYDANGSVVRKEDYTACMCSYVESIDAAQGIYPLTEDLVYMLKNGGAYKGWWDPDSGNYIFKDANGNPKTINEELGWMFAVCYVK